LNHAWLLLVASIGFAACSALYLVRVFTA